YTYRSIWEYSSAQLIDLPDEILLIIFKNLNKRDVFSLTLFNYLPCDCIYPLPDLILDQFYLQILPKIHHKIKSLDLEPLSMKRLLLSRNYPNLFRLDTQIIFCANYFLEQNEDECYIYSYPYKITRYENIEKNFPGRLFTRGFEVSLFDEHSLEHEFFIQIVQSFPFMRSLTLANREAQNDKQCRKLEK
ncbi:unnamed protein product, partial [Rotaria socialis]